MIRKFLFLSAPQTRLTSTFLLAVRLIFGFLMMSHGLQKLINYEALANTFPDPLGVGSEISLILAIFGEMVCSIAFILGFLYRLALVPMIFTMGVAYFIVLDGQPFDARELAFIYLTVFVLMYIVGPGDYAIDRFFRPKDIRGL